MKAPWIVRRRERHEVVELECWTESFAWHIFTFWCAQWPQATVTQICVGNHRVVRKRG